jgi:broad specificity phosphatase PhoE
VLREAGVLVTDLRSSRWCRATQTAELAFPDVPLKPEASLDSFFNEPGREQEQTKQARALISSWRRRQGTLALVTHQVNITALTGLLLLKARSSSCGRRRRPWKWLAACGYERLSVHGQFALRRAPGPRQQIDKDLEVL